MWGNRKRRNKCDKLGGWGGNLPDPCCGCLFCVCCEHRKLSTTPWWSRWWHSGAIKLGTNSQGDIYLLDRSQEAYCLLCSLDDFMSASPILGVWECLTWQTPTPLMRSRAYEGWASWKSMTNPHCWVPGYLLYPTWTVFLLAHSDQDCCY